MLRNKYRETIEMIKEYAEDLPTIECYPGKVNQVFMNIINNAIQAIEGNGKIYIGIQLVEKSLKGEVFQKKYMEIRIQDTGKGMPESIQQKIFDPFYTTKDVGQGTGLGLSISLGIIQKHKGVIECVSQEGEGTTFGIYLPIHQDA